MKNVLKAKHGTSFIIINADDTVIEDEAERFSNHKRGELCGVNLTESSEKLYGFSKVDGGMILSVDGKCYAYSVIFDGRINSKPGKIVRRYIGTHERGSRFNSMRLYIANAEFCCLGIVFSDDGGIDIIGKKGAYNTKKGYFV